MGKKAKIIIIAVVAVIAIAVAYFWYNSQYDDNLVKAYGYEKIGLESINNDFKELWGVNRFTGIDIIKKNVSNIQKDIDEYNKTIQKVDFYLNKAKKYGKTDAEREYIDLLLKKNEANKKSIKNCQAYLNVLTEYVNWEIGVVELDNKTLEFQNKCINIDSENIDNGNEIIALLNNNPDFKQHLKSLNLNETYFWIF